MTKTDHDKKRFPLGDGQPKICVPLTGGTAEELFQEAEKIKEAGADLAEWQSGFLRRICPIQTGL